MKWGSLFLLGLFPTRSLRYKIWSKAQREMTKYTREESDGITELCAGPGYMKNKYPIESFESALLYHLNKRKCQFQLDTMLT